LALHPSLAVSLGHQGKQIPDHARRSFGLFFYLDDEMPVKGHAALANPRSRGKDSRLVINSSYDPKEMEHEEKKRKPWSGVVFVLKKQHAPFMCFHG